MLAIAASNRVNKVIQSYWRDSRNYVKKKEKEKEMKVPAKEGKGFRSGNSKVTTFECSAKELAVWKSTTLHNCL